MATNPLKPGIKIDVGTAQGWPCLIQFKRLGRKSVEPGIFKVGFLILDIVVVRGDSGGLGKWS